MKITQPYILLTSPDLYMVSKIIGSRSLELLELEAEEAHEIAYQIFTTPEEGMIVEFPSSISFEHFVQLTTAFHNVRIREKGCIIMGFVTPNELTENTAVFQDQTIALFSSAQITIEDDIDELNIVCEDSRYYNIDLLDFEAKKFNNDMPFPAAFLEIEKKELIKTGVLYIQKEADEL